MVIYLLYISEVCLSLKYYVDNPEIVIPGIDKYPLDLPITDDTLSKMDLLSVSLVLVKEWKQNLIKVFEHHLK